jgi:O-antigen/teichoic acid export membrane protein
LSLRRRSDSGWVDVFRNALPVLIRQTLFYLPAQLIGPTLQFIAAVVWTHWLSPDDYGVLLFLMASQELIFVISLSWWSAYTMRYLGALADAAERSRYLASESAILLITSVVMIVAAVLTLASLSALGDPVLVMATLLYTVTRCVTNHLSERARAASRILDYTFAQTFGPLVGFLLAFIVVSSFSATPGAALFGFAIAQCLALIWLGRRMGLSLRGGMVEPVMLKQALRFGTPLVIAGMVGWISVNGLRVIIDQRMGAEAMGLVSVGWGLGQRLSGTAAMLVTAAAFPLAVKHFQTHSRDAALAQLANSGTLLFALLLPATLGLVLVAKDLSDLMIAAPFRSLTESVLPIAALAGGVRNMRMHFNDQVFLLVERTDLSILINAIEATAVVLCCWIGLDLHGLVGAAEGCLAGSLFATLFGFGLTHIAFGLRIRWTDVGRIVVATAAMGIAVYLLPIGRASTGDSLALAEKIVVGAFTYAMALALLYPKIWRTGPTRDSQSRAGFAGGFKRPRFKGWGYKG